MTEQEMATFTGELKSPGGFVFGIQGWTWGEQKPTAITFLLDGTATVTDQHGRPVKGVIKDGKPMYFAKCTHAVTLAALASENIDWRKLVRAGWPQLPYEELKSVPDLPPTPIVELRKITDPQLRKDAIKMRRDMDAERKKNGQQDEEEEL